MSKLFCYAAQYKNSSPEMRQLEYYKYRCADLEAENKKLKKEISNLQDDLTRYSYCVPCRIAALENRIEELEETLGLLEGENDLLKSEHEKYAEIRAMSKEDRAEIYKFAMERSDALLKGDE